MKTISRMMPAFLVRSRSLWACSVLLLVIGCSSEPERGMVSGQVTQGGQPLEEVMVYFMPDPDKQTAGAMSTAVTDAEGKYVLEYSTAPGGPGAVCGWHRVTMEDLASENFRGQGQPPAPRIPPRLMNAGGTPLKFEIKPGEQIIDLELDDIKLNAASAN